MTTRPDLTDTEVDAICDGLTQNAAKARYLVQLGMHVMRRPNGRPLVMRAHAEQVLFGDEPTEPPAAPAVAPIPFEETGLGKAQARWRANRQAIEAERQELYGSSPALTKKELRDQQKERDQLVKQARAALVRFHAARRRTLKLQRTPPWADQALILAVYREAKAISEATGVQHHVDHVYPLQGELVSGLHVHNNLQVLPWRENLVKRNRFEIEE